MESEHTALAGQQRSTYSYAYKSKNDQNMSSTAPRIDKRPYYYCDHCKIPGHSIQRCFKVHGYPPGHKLYNKNKRMVAAVQADHTSSHIESALTALVPGLTAEQYTQLMALL